MLVLNFGITEGGGEEVISLGLAYLGIGCCMFFIPSPLISSEQSGVILEINSLDRLLKGCSILLPKAI